MLFEACRQAQAWRREGLRALRVAVNLAPSQFRLTNLVEQIRRALDASGLDPQLLEVELTESAVMSDAEESIHILEAISRMGVLVSVDDFGTGYSSMSYLRRFPIDKLKIDRCFVEQMTGAPRGRLDRARDHLARPQPAPQGDRRGRGDAASSCSCSPSSAATSTRGSTSAPPSLPAQLFALVNRGAQPHG